MQVWTEVKENIPVTEYVGYFSSLGFKIKYIKNRVSFRLNKKRQVNFSASLNKRFIFIRNNFFKQVGNVKFFKISIYSYLIVFAILFTVVLD